MRPIQLKGHSRPISSVVFNYDGDLLFSGAQDKNICVWYTHNGERLGSYSGQGAVTSMLVDRATKNLISGSGDGYVRLWDVETGNKVSEGHMGLPVRSLAFAEGHQEFAVLCPAKMGQKLDYVRIYSLNSDLKGTCTKAPVMEFYLEHNHKRDTPTCLLYSPVNRNLYIGTDTGLIDVYDLRQNGKFDGTLKAHEDAITNMSYSNDMHTILTSSKDRTAKLLNATSLETIRTYKSDKPVNSAVASPVFDHVVLGGGQEARDVTTKGEEGGFQARFYSKVYENLIGILDLGHIGPINSVAAYNDMIATGGEDSVVYLCTLDPQYFNEQ